jgi:branched-subunit amino acid transport protein
VAPLVVWPTATGGVLDMPRLVAALTTLAVGYVTQNVLAAIFGGAAMLYLLLYLMG